MCSIGLQSEILTREQTGKTLAIEFHGSRLLSH